MAAKLLVSILLNLQTNGWKYKTNLKFYPNSKSPKSTKPHQNPSKVKWTQLRIKIHGKPSWWLNQPLWKNMLVKMGSSSPIFGLKISKYFKPPPRLHIEKVMRKNGTYTLQNWLVHLKITQMMFLDSINQLLELSQWLHVIGILGGNCLGLRKRKSCWNHQIFPNPRQESWSKLILEVRHLC